MTDLGLTQIGFPAAAGRYYLTTRYSVTVSQFGIALVSFF